MAKTSALAVANFLLDAADAERRPLTHLKLQKLLFFCYAWYAGNKGEPLFPEEFEAWQYGPVVRDVWEEFKDCKSSAIKTRATEVDWVDGAAEVVRPNVTDEQLKQDIRAVWDQYKSKSTPWLVEVSHAATEPWGLWVAEFGANTDKPIPFGLVKSVYKKKVEEIAA